MWLLTNFSISEHYADPVPALLVWHTGYMPELN